MNTVKAKIIVICGPTASGKSDVAIKLAKKFNGEIISADSRQVYRGMNIGSGKVDGIYNIEEQAFISENIPHYLIDVADPNEEFNISHFKKLASEAIEKILAKGKLPIICGGTGFWIQAITDDLHLPEVPPNEILRNSLKSKSSEELFYKLEKLDPERSKNIDKKNKYRLIRALEIIDAIKKVPGESSVINHQSSKYDFLQIGIKVEKEILIEKIKRRLELRFDQGMIEEVKNLHESGVSWERLEYFGLEYRWIARFLQGKFERGEIPAKDHQALGAKGKLYYDIIHYAKRQMTWFKKNKEIIWLENCREIEKEVQKFYKKIGLREH